MAASRPNASRPPSQQTNKKSFYENNAYTMSTPVTGQSKGISGAIGRNAAAAAKNAQRPTGSGTKGASAANTRSRRATNPTVAKKSK